jgi:ribonuclease E
VPAAAGTPRDATDETADETADDGSDDGSDDEGDDGDEGTGTRRRRRRRRRGAASGAAAGTEDPADTVVHIREPRRKAERARDADEVTGLKGSTRLEAKKVRRREGVSRAGAARRS